MRKNEKSREMTVRCLEERLHCSDEIVVPRLDNLEHEVAELVSVQTALRDAVQDMVGDASRHLRAMEETIATKCEEIEDAARRTSLMTLTAGVDEEVKRLSARLVELENIADEFANGSCRNRDAIAMLSSRVGSLEQAGTAHSVLAMRCQSLEERQAETLDVVKEESEKVSSLTQRSLVFREELTRAVKGVHGVRSRVEAQDRSIKALRAWADGKDELYRACITGESSTLESRLQGVEDGLRQERADRTQLLDLLSQTREGERDRGRTSQSPHGTALRSRSGGAPDVFARLASRVERVENGLVQLRHTLADDMYIANGDDASDHVFFFVDRSDLLALDSSRGGLPSHEEFKKRGLLHRECLNLADALRGRYKKSHLCLSHRWYEADVPDEDGSQLRALQEFLLERTDIVRVWIDCTSLPQDLKTPRGEVLRRRSATEEDYFQRALKTINFLYLNTWVLILLDRDYNRRFWCMLEAYLGMRVWCSETLQSSLTDPHHTVKCLGTMASMPDRYRDTLQRECDLDLDCMLTFLGQKDIAVTNGNDKVLMSKRLERLSQELLNIERAAR
jgi:hypothetical protein